MKEKPLLLDLLSFQKGKENGYEGKLIKNKIVPSHLTGLVCFFAKRVQMTVDTR